MEIRKPNLNSEFFENAEDPLKDFKKTYSGAARCRKDGSDPFEDDPDMKQARRQFKLQKDIQNTFLGGY
jgi:hypothetical protein